MEDITREQLHAYLDDTLADTEMARVEQALRESEVLRLQLRQVREERDRGEHSLGAIWRRHRISCCSREELNGYLHDILEPEFRAYVEFHLKIIACPTCIANLDDLQEKQAQPTAQEQRRKKIFHSSAGLLQGGSPQQRR